MQNEQVTKKKKRKSVPLTKSSKKVILFCICIIVVLLIIFAIGLFVPSFAELIWYNFRNIYFGVGFKIFQFNPNIGAWYDVGLYAFMMIILVIQLFIELSKKMNFKKKTILANRLTKIVFILATFVIMVPMLIDINTFNSPKINEKYFNEHLNEQYEQEDIVQLANFFKEKVMTMIHGFDRMNGEIVYSKDLSTQAVEDLKNISNKYVFLKGMYPNKVADFTEYERKHNKDLTLGYTRSFGVVVDMNENNVELLNTITHELCHVKGTLRESETEFCAYIANASSKDLFSNYSAYYNALYRVTGALSFIDKELSLDVEESFTNLCLSNEYSEACNFYSKQVNNFIDGTDYYESSSHRLRNYKDYSNGFLEVLSYLTRNYNATLTIEDKEVDIPYINNAIKNSSKEIVKIKFDAKEEDFEGLSNYLKDYQKYLLSFYQIDEDYEDYEYLYGKEALEYYVKPFNEVDYKLLLDGTWADEYYYERVTRLFLEYYNDIVKK